MFFPRAAGKDACARGLLRPVACIRTAPFRAVIAHDHPGKGRREIPRMPNGTTVSAGQPAGIGPSSTPKNVRIFLLSIILLGSTAIWHELAFGALHARRLAFFLIPLAALAGTATLNLYRLGRLNPVFPFVLVTLLACGTPAAVLAGLAAGLAGTLISTRSADRIKWAVFESGTGIFAAWVAGWLFFQAGGQLALQHLQLNVNPLIAASLVYLMTVLLFSQLGRVHMPDPEERFPSNVRIWKPLAGFTLGGGMGYGLALLLVQFGRWQFLTASGLLLLPFFIKNIHQYFDHLAQHREERMTGIYLSIIEALAVAIDAKDQTPFGHLKRVQYFSVQIGLEMRIPRQELEALKTAALLHDIGKLAVPEYILSKPGKLTDDEFERMTIHPTVGAEILESVPFTFPVEKIVRTHHEKFDGTGYPDGIEGKQIPVGGRILAVVDSYDALTSDRPYRKAVSRAQALRYIQDQSGKDFDPQVVEILLRKIDRMEMEYASNPETRRRPAALSQEDGPVEARSLQRSLKEIPSSTINQISASYREIYSLYEIVQTLSQSLNLEEALTEVTGKISPLIPFRCCVLYLMERSQQDLYARFVSGDNAEALKAIRIPLGERVSGWSALQRKPILWTQGETPREGGPTRFDIEGLPPDSPLKELSTSLVAPLCTDDGELNGVLALYNSGKKIYTEDHLRLIRIIAYHLAYTVRNSLLYQETQESALTDPLTTLPNARYLFVSFEEDLNRASNLRIPLTIVELDVDNFKDINDVYGHLVGDKILRGIAQAIRSQLRGCDSCVRYAGDEFIVIFPGVGREDVDYVEHRLGSCVESFKYSPRPGKNIGVKVSLGSATFPEEGHNFESLIGIADARMYAKKYRKKREYQDSSSPPIPPARSAGKK